MIDVFMDKKSIILLLIITAIMIALAMSIFYEVPDIDDIEISTSIVAVFDMNMQSEKSFDKNEDDIFLHIKTKNLSPKDKIKVFFKKEDGSLFQENIIAIENKGSAIIALPLLKINDSLQPDNYHVEVFLNEQFSHELSFRID
jgi:hypothetical protein